MTTRVCLHSYGTSLSQALSYQKSHGGIDPTYPDLDQALKVTQQASMTTWPRNSTLPCLGQSGTYRACPRLGQSDTVCLGQSDTVYFSPTTARLEQPMGIARWCG